MNDAQSWVRRKKKLSKRNHQLMQLDWFSVHMLSKLTTDSVFHLYVFLSEIYAIIYF